MDILQIYRQLETQQALIDLHLTDTFNLNSLETPQGICSPITLRHCHIDRLHALGIDFHKPVLLEDCHFRRATFYGSYFLQGLTLRRCTFEQRVDFEFGGHNAHDCAVTIEDCVFRGFANFFDCWFNGPVIVRDTRFEGGTNLLGLRGVPGEVLFEVRPVIQNVFGRVDANLALL